ncbi:phage antirepressor KilAC domain-containing protein [Pseudomonas gingeri]|uniref:phage antirepressor KilAC domain-containing protein n=1 Tax=Pseudomonas gingeri TaxID=117681 RepID=UPI0015BE6892|nr:phage regulatory protein/antirepressor Ant [Pseudomonas gingeri]NWD49046.1 phage antirepressor KilAC domain-containing protein [Pseudomonas gingeri]
MSSREIAELTGSTHDNVMKTIRSLVSKGIVSSNDTPYTHQQNGQVYREFLLSQRDTLVVVSGYSVELRARIIDRWQELEARAVGQLQVPTNFAEALQLAADQARQNAELQQVIRQQAPKVQALDRLAGTNGSICITSAAKQLGVGPLKLFKWMSDNRWIYRRASFAAWSAYQPRLSAGLLEHKLVKVGHGTEEELKVVEQVMVTRKGITTLAEQLQGNRL